MDEDKVETEERVFVIKPDISQEEFDALDENSKLTISLVASATEKRGGFGISESDLKSAVWLAREIRVQQDMLEALLTGALETMWPEDAKEPLFRTVQPKKNEVGN